MTVYFTLGIAIIIGIVVFAIIKYTEKQLQYRIKEETKIITNVASEFNDKEITYYPQYKKFLFWHNFNISHPAYDGSYWYETVHFNNKAAALKYINECKENEKKRVFVKDTLTNYIYLQ